MVSKKLEVKKTPRFTVFAILGTSVAVPSIKASATRALVAAASATPENPAGIAKKPNAGAVATSESSKKGEQVADKATQDLGRVSLCCMAGCISGSAELLCDFSLVFSPSQNPSLYGGRGSTSCDMSEVLEYNIFFFFI